ncbi:hypothetical protein CIK05_00280 [Bdellovibrio sp. qaytius]|nr:hypothetical protein CIK05_00280 [Bdellovibrio sp. qaytius]
MIRLFSLLISITFFAAPTFAGWTIWVSLGGGITSDPAACTVRGITYVAVRGEDNKIWYRKRTLSTGIWDNWKQVPSNITFSGAPSVFCRAYQNHDWFEVQAVGSADQLIYKSYLLTDTAFSQWSLITYDPQKTLKVAAGSGLSAPNVDPLALATPMYFARGTNDYLYYSTCYDTHCFDSWNPISPPVLSDPAAAYQNSGRLDLVVQASTGTLIHRFFENGAWYPFQYMGSGTVYSSPDMVSRYLGSLDLFVRGPNNILQTKRWINGVWGGWTNLGSPAGRGIYSGPGATTYASKARIFVFARGYDNALWYRAWAP